MPAGFCYEAEASAMNFNAPASCCFGPQSLRYELAELTTFLPRAAGREMTAFPGEEHTTTMETTNGWRFQNLR